MLQKWKKNLKEQVRSWLRQSAEITKRAITEKIDLTCHDLETLRRMGHPYSRTNPRPPHDPSYVHIQSGQLKDNLETYEGERDDILFVRVGIEEEKVPYLPHLIHGTRRMIARDFLSAAFEEVKERIKFK